ncbi:MAG: hypothetical protein U7123_25315 [Potamolinea sp.]
MLLFVILGWGFWILDFGFWIGTLPIPASSPRVPISASSQAWGLGKIPKGGQWTIGDIL